MGLKDKFKHLPDALQKQVVLRLAIGAVFFVLFLIVQFCMGDIYFSLPCVVFGGVMIVNGGLLFYNSTKGNFISVRVCAGRSRRQEYENGLGIFT